MSAASSDASHDEATPKRRWFGRLRRLVHPSNRVSLIVVVYIFGAAVTWATLTPVGAAPDEPAHIAYAASVVRGDLGELVPGGDDSPRRFVVVTAPEWVNSFTVPPGSIDEFRYPCFATIVSRTANCAPELSGSRSLTEVPTTVGRYPPLYHLIVGLPTLVLAGEPAVYAMRLVSAALAAGMVAIGLAIASPTRRSWLALGAAIAFTPAAGHLAGSVNPSGLEISAAMALGIGLMGTVGSGPLRRGAAGLLVAPSLALAWSRPLGYLTLGVVIVAAILINSDQLRAWLRDRATRTYALAGTSAALVSAVAYRAFFGLPARVASANDPTTGSTLFSPVGLGAGLEKVEDHLIGWTLDLVGKFGWADHAPPVAVILGWVLLTLVLALFVFLHGSRRDRIGLTVIGLAALILTPLVAITTVVNSSAYEARYHLPVAVLIILGLSTAASTLRTNDARSTTWSILRWGAILVPAGMLISVAASVHRYSVGVEAQLVDLATFAAKFKEWLPPTNVLVLGAVGLAITAAAVPGLAWASRETVGENHQPAGHHPELGGRTDPDRQGRRSPQR